MKTQQYLASGLNLMKQVDEGVCWQIFLRAAELGSLSRVAEEFSLNKSSISRTLLRLETTLNLDLFIRGRQGVTLTLAGKALYQKIKPLFEEFSATTRELSQYQGVASSVRVSCPAALGYGLIVPWIVDFQAQFPEIFVDLSLTIGPVRMVPSGIDIRISHGWYPAERMINHALGFTPRMMVASKSYLEREGVPENPEDLRRHFLLGANDLLGNEPLILTRDNEQVVIPYLPKLRTHCHTSARIAALAGAGISVHAFRFDTQPFVDQGTLVHVLSQWEPTPAPVSLLVPVGKTLSGAAKKMMSYIQERWRLHPELLCAHELGMRL